MSAFPYRNANAAPARSPKRRRSTGSRRDWIVGTLVELDPAGKGITVRVDRGGRPLPRRDTEITVDVSAARVRATDGDGDGRSGLTDLFPGDRVQVLLDGGRAPVPVARRIEQQSPGASRGALRPLWRLAHA